MRNIILMMTLCFSFCLCAQEIPLPQKCFPLNGTDSEDIMSGQTADIHGAVHALADRFGTNGKAISFDKEDSYLSFPLVTSGEQGQRELTLTYWLYVGQDSISQAFWTKDQDGNLLFGMKRKGVRAVLDIYHTDNQKNVLPDQQWMWDDSNFNEGKGWYIVALTYSDDGTHFYLVTPKGKMTECYSAFIPDWNLFTSMCIGAVDHIPSTGIDDFKIYDTALSGEQVSILYQFESQFSMGSESLFNVETGIPLYSSTWYFHCVGFQGALQHTLQNQSDLSFLSADAGYALSMTSDVESDNQKWSIYPMKDTAKGRLYTIINIATGMSLSDTREGVFQQVPDNADSQRWCIGQWEGKKQIKSDIGESHDIPLLFEEIYFDKGAGVIRVHIRFPEGENVRIRLTDSQGMLLKELLFSNVQLLERDIRLQINGVCLVIVESDNYRINKKVFVNS